MERDMVVAQAYLYMKLQDDSYRKIVHQLQICVRRTHK